MRYNPTPPLSGLLPHNNSREGFTAPHHGSLNLGGGRGSSSSHSYVKEGLRHAIHARRALSHNPIISQEDLAPRNIQFKLTPEEEEKRKVRREKNKLAASKCRNKKREQVTNTKKEYDAVTQHNSHMEREIEKLKQERIRLEQTLKQHQCSLGGAISEKSSTKRIKLKIDADVRLNLKF
ncbi:hypothetical protein ACHWQZ_G017944 [Mnemiopsis leidyi]